MSEQSLIHRDHRRRLLNKGSHIVKPFGFSCLPGASLIPRPRREILEGYPLDRLNC